jgi:hypothetical protein
MAYGDRKPCAIRYLLLKNKGPLEKRGACVVEKTIKTRYVGRGAVVKSDIIQYLIRILKNRL